MTISSIISLRHNAGFRHASFARNKQRGVVLVVSLIFLIALTAVASALMLNTTTDMKMSGASEMQVVANQEAFAAMDELVFRQITSGAGQVNEFILPIVLYQNDVTRDVLGDLVSTNTDADITSATVGIGSNEFNLNVGCPREKVASGEGQIFCNILQVQVNKVYGRNNNSSVQVNAGIIQKLKKN